jgi:hypothetical protein
VTPALRRVVRALAVASALALGALLGWDRAFGFGVGDPALRLLLVWPIAILLEDRERPWRSIGAASIAGVLLLGPSALPVALPILLVRRSTRELEWQALGAVASALLAFSALLVRGGHGWDPAIAATLAGTLAATALYAADRALGGEPMGPALPRGALVTVVVALTLVWPWGALTLWLGAPRLTWVDREDVLATLQATREAEEAYHLKAGRFARSLSDLELGKDLAAGCKGGYLYRYTTLSNRGRWLLAADPSTPDLSSPHYLIDESGEVRRGPLPFPTFPGP